MDGFSEKKTRVCDAAAVHCCFFLFSCIPESIRWLSLKGRLKDAEEILQRAAIWNKKVLPPLALKPIETLKGTTKSASYLDLFKKCKIIKVVFAQVFVW